MKQKTCTVVARWLRNSAIALVALAPLSLFADGNDMGYAPVATRVSSLEAGKQYFIFNTCFNSNVDLTGFLQQSESGFGSYAKKYPANFITDDKAFLWTLEEGSQADCWYIRNVGSGTYADTKGKTDNTSPADVMITDFSTSAFKKGGTRSRNDDGTLTAFASLTPANHVWMIGNGGQDMWSGHSGTSFLTWDSGQPYAFYEVREITPNQHALELLAAVDLSTQGKIGYPADSYYEALRALKTEAESMPLAGDFYSRVNAALDAFNKTADKNITLKDGQAYVIIGQNPATSVRYYIEYSPVADEMVYTALGDGLPTSATAKFIARNLDNGRVVLLNGYHGGYLAFKSDLTAGGTNDNKGYTETYSTGIAFNDITLTAHNTQMGKVFIALRRNDHNNAYSPLFCPWKETAGTTYYGSSSGSPLYTIEAVEYENTPELKDATGIGGTAAVATWSAPFATVIPQGVRAYYVHANDGTMAMLTSIEEVVPACEGVLLVSDNQGKITMMPAITETATPLSGNLLGNTAGADKEIEEGSLILGRKNGLTAFYAVSGHRTLKLNRSYLKPGVGGNARIISFDNLLTSIGQLRHIANITPCAYDLSGRQAKSAYRGISIREGKKYLVK